MVNPEDRMNSVSYTNLEGVKVPLYQRFIGDKTECWFFGSGLGEFTMFRQMGDSFLQMVDEGNDPELGRIMFSMGHGDSAFMSYKGDYNVVWTWGLPINKLEPYLKRLQVKPDLFMSNDPPLNEHTEKLGVKSIQMCAGVNPSMFYPLNLERKGIGYCGVDNKGKRQFEIMIKPALRYDFQWISKFKDELLEISDLNIWYNKKQLVLGMVHESRQNVRYIPTRVIETLATATPLIIYKIHELEESLGFKYLYQSTHPDMTDKMINYIIDNPEKVNQEFKKYSEDVVEIHDYKIKLGKIFEELRDVK